MALAANILVSASYGFGKKAPKDPVPVHPGGASSSSQSSSAPEVEPVPRLTFSPVKNYSAKDLSGLLKAEDKIEDTVSSQCFENFMVGRKLIQTGGRTEAQVVDHLRSLTGKVPVTMYYKNNSVVGYRNTGSPIVYTNLKFHAGTTPCNRASNLAHEALGHVLGKYSHDYKASKSRPYSVPYSLNAAFKACCVN